MITGSALWPAERRRVGEFAARLEDERSTVGADLEPLVALAATLRPARLAPAPQFRAELRARLLREAAARPPGAVPRQRTSPARHTHRLARAAAAATAVTVIGGAGLAAASTHSLPGDGLYPLKRSVESLELSLTRSDLDRGRELLEQADTRLTEAERMAASEQAREQATLARIDTALAEMRTAVDGGSLALTDAYGDTGDPEALLLLERFVSDQRERLADLMSMLDPRLRDEARALTERLDELEAQAGRLTGDVAALGGDAAPAGGHPLAGRLARPPGGVSDPSTVGDVRDVPAAGTAGGGGTDAVPDTRAALPGVTEPLGDGVTGEAKLPLPSPTGSGTSTSGSGATPAPLPTRLEVEVPCVPVPPASSC
ncbi:MAG: DUF5667 domain-containing protein [Actinomycetes bacterium]